MILRVRGLPPTDNHLYRTGKDGRRYKTASARKWERQVGDAFLEGAGYLLRRRFQNEPLRIEIVFHMTGMYTQAGDMRRWDVSSHQKLTVDAVCGLLGRDDAHVLDLLVRKRPAELEDVTEIRVGVGMSSSFSD